MRYPRTFGRDHAGSIGTPIEQLAAVTSEMTPPAADVDAVRLHLFDALAAFAAGSRLPEGRAAALVARDLEGDGERPRGPAAEALFRCVATRCTEVDDVDLGSCTTPGAVAVPAATALAAAVPGVDAERLFAAIVVGYEVVVRVGRAIDGPRAHADGTWPTLVAAAMGAAAAGSRLLGSSAELTAHSLVLAAASSSGISAGAGGDLSGHWLALGLAVQAGVSAACGARRGFRGDPARLLAGIVPATACALTEGLGGPPALAAVSIKPWCSAKQIVAPVTAFTELLDRDSIEPSVIESVVIAVAPEEAKLIDRPDPSADRLGGITSAQYQLALAALFRDELCDVVRARAHREGPFRDLMSRISVVPDETLTAHRPRSWPARVTVRAAGSPARTATVVQAPGDPDDPLDWDQVLAKHRAARSGLAASALSDLATTCSRLGEGASLSDLWHAVRALEPGDAGQACDAGRTSRSDTSTPAGSERAKAAISATSSGTRFSPGR